VHIRERHEWLQAIEGTKTGRERMKLSFSTSDSGMDDAERLGIKIMSYWNLKDNADLDCERLNTGPA